MIKVIATERGYDGLTVREVGTEFDMPDDVFDRRPKLNEYSEPILGQFYEPPSWFEPVDKSLKAKVEADRKEIKKGNRMPTVDPARQEAARQASLRKAASEKAAADKAAEDRQTSEEKKT